MSEAEIEEALVRECRRREESCQYTHVALYLWAKESTNWHRLFIGGPAIAAVLATSSIIADVKWLAAVFAITAGGLPALYDSLKLAVHYDKLVSLAADFRNLEERFRLTREVTRLKGLSEIDGEARGLFDAHDELRLRSLPIPDRVFERARAKIKAGRYEFDADAD